MFIAGPSRTGPGDQTPGHVRSVVMAFGAAAGFGLVLYAISRGSRSSAVMTMLTMRGTSVPVLLVVAVVAFRPGSVAGTELAARRSERTSGLALLIALCGVFDVGANLLFGVATTSGTLLVVAVLGSLYPAGTVLLARVVDGERLSRVQNSGMIAALAGVAMIAAGS